MKYVSPLRWKGKGDIIREERKEGMSMEMETIRREDPEIAKAIEMELERQRSHIELIASENFVSPAVMAATLAVLLIPPDIPTYIISFPASSSGSKASWNLPMLIRQVFTSAPARMAL